MILNELSMNMTKLPISCARYISSVFHRADILPHALNGSDRYDIALGIRSNSDIQNRLDHENAERYLFSQDRNIWTIHAFAYDTKGSQFVAVAYCSGRAFVLISAPIDFSFEQKDFKILTGYELNRETLRQLDDAYPGNNFVQKYNVAKSIYDRAISNIGKRGKRKPSPRYRENNDDFELDDDKYSQYDDMYGESVEINEALDILRKSGYNIL